METNFNRVGQSVKNNADEANHVKKTPSLNDVKANHIAKVL